MSAGIRPPVRGHLAFESVSAVREDGGLVLDRLSFDIEAGIRLGMAGLTVGQKRVFVQLLTGAAAPSGGRILLDGVDLRDSDRAYLRNQISTVLREDVLSAGTVADNIAGSRPGVPRADVVAAAEAVNAHQSIVRLTGGYDAPAAGPGVSLPSRQRLHILLARAFFMGAPILLLDEPGRRRGDVAEIALRQALERLMTGRTVIVFADQPGGLASCDAWLRVKEGRRIEPRGPAAGRDPLPPCVTAATIRAHQLDHPAVRAWGRLRSVRVESARVEVLSEREKRAVYRLQGVGPDDAPVIARWRRRDVALPEHSVHAEVLPRLPEVDAPRYYGVVEEENGFCWLFSEDVGGGRYSPHLAEHRSLAGRWLGTLHASAQRAGLETGQSRRPFHKPERYRTRLEAARAAIRSSLEEPALQPGELEVLRTILSHLERVASSWERAERLVAAMPRTLVHGDFHEHNLRVRAESNGPRLTAFDWEFAGLGVPAADLAFMQLDAEAYRSSVRHHWPGLDVSTVLAWAAVGRIFRCIDDIRGQAPLLAADRRAGPMQRLREYESELAAAIRELNWDEGIVPR